MIDELYASTKSIKTMSTQLDGILLKIDSGEGTLGKLINDDSRVKKLTDLSLKLEGLNRNVATHAAGVVIADKKLTEVVPLY